MKNRTVLIISAALVAACVVVLGCAALIGGITFLQRQIAPLPEPSGAIDTPYPTSTPVVVRPPIFTIEPQFNEPDESSSSDSLHAPIIDTPSAIEYPVAPDTLETLRDVKIPINDPLDIIKRFEGRIIPSTAVDQAPVPLSIGALESFWVIDTDINRSFQVNAVLRQVSDHVYFWIEESIDYYQDDLTRLVNTFENQIYPTNRTFFGSEWTPGVDGDPHLYILYASGLGDSVAGLFSPGDEYPVQAIEYSNEHEMFLLNADTVGLDETFTYGVLAHEFQHMIHWNRDRNEQSWLNEGFAELAMLLNGYETGGVARLYTYDTDIQLNDWPHTDQDSLPHYGASFLFVTYFLDRFGEEATQALVAEPENGLVSIDSLLQNTDIAEMHSNRALSADDVFADWVVANYLQDKNVGDGRYSYSNLPSAPSPMETETISNCPSIGNTRDVHQYGVDYVRITCPGEHTLNFEGSVQVDLLPTDPHSGEFAFWSNKGDESDMTLTRRFDFRDHSGPLTFNYWTWYDLEDNFDYVYLLASQDGETWQILITPSGTPDDPTGRSYGWAYNGESVGNNSDTGQAGWIHESIDISHLAGKQVYLRFEYLTDAAVNGEGFLVDDVAIPSTGYISDFEQDDGGWTGEGFVRIQNRLPQTFRLALIKRGRTTTVDHYNLDGDNALSIRLEIGGDVEEVVLVISGTTRFTRQKAAYRFSIE